MSSKITDLFNLFDQFMQSTPRIAQATDPVQQPQPAAAGDGLAMKRIKSRKLQSSQVAAKVPGSPGAEFLESGTSTVLFGQELSQTARDVRSKHHSCYQHLKFCKLRG
jgi:hypothetical protein